jgi:hypothetical protein
VHNLDAVEVSVHLQHTTPWEQRFDSEDLEHYVISCIMSYPDICCCKDHYQGVPDVQALLCTCCCVSDVSNKIRRKPKEANEEEVDEKSRVEGV